MITGVPTALSPHETRTLQRFASGRRVVEAGALLGYSTIKLAEVAAAVVSIDKHTGYTAPTYRRFMSNLQRAGVAGKVTPIIGDALAELPLHPADFAFIDLTCDFDLTLRAVRAARATLVGVHDFERNGCGGIARLIAVLQWPVVERSDTLIILRRPHART